MSPKNEYKLSRWSLKDLFPSPDSPELTAAFKTLTGRVADFEKNRARLTDAISSEQFLKIVKQLEAIERLGYRLGGYSELWLTEDTQNQAAQALSARVQQFLAELANRTLFFSLWWKVYRMRLPPPDEDSGDYHYWLVQMRHFKPFTLSEPEERILNIKNVTGVTSLIRLYQSIYQPLYVQGWSQG